MKTKFYFLLMMCFCLTAEIFGQLNVSNFPPVTNGSPTWLVKNMLIGANSGIQVSNVQLSVGDSSVQVGYFDGTASNVGLPSGILLSTGDIQQAPGSGFTGNNASYFVNTANSDSDLELLINNSSSTNDAVVLEFDFVATRSSYAFNYVFASEEYEEYVCSQYNDVFGFFLSGPGITGPYSNNAVNVALIPGKPVPVTINTVNGGVAGSQGSDSFCEALDTAWLQNSVHYISNVSDTSASSIEFDGFTVPLKAVLSGLVCGQTYHIKIAIADVSDQQLDSGVFLEKGSFTTNVYELGITSGNGTPINVDTAIVEGCDSANLLVIRPDTIGTDTLPILYSGTALAGVDYTSLPSQVIFTPGVDTIAIPFGAILDGNPEGLENLVITIPASTGTCLTDSSSLEVNIFDGYNSFLSYTDETCGAANGTIQVTTNATVTASLLWNDGDTSANRQGLSAGTYTVTITDIAGCTQVLTASLNNVTLDSIFTTVDSAITCNGTCNGVASVTVSGGVQPYAYQWNDANAQTTATAVGLCAGTYAVVVTDSLGCSITDSVTLTEPVAIVADTSSTPENCGLADGSACVTVSGGVAPYQITWGTGDTTSCINNVAAGFYNVTVVDANGCSVVASAVVNSNGSSFTSISTVEDSAITCNGQCNGVATVSVSGGVQPYTYLWNDPNAQTTPTAVGLCAGSYLVVVTDSLGCTISDSITINEPAALVADTSSTPENCGAADGSACVTVSGGTAPYAVLWSNGDSSLCINGVAAGVYAVTVTDANGCSVVETAVVGSNGATFTGISTNLDSAVTCAGQCDAVATVTVTGGVLPYFYQWNDPNGQTTPTAVGLCAGNYLVVVTDSFGCTITDSITIADPAALVLSTSTTDENCGAADGTACVTPAGGTAPYTVSWGTGDTSLCITNLVAGTYSVTVTDANGCSNVATAVVQANTAACCPYEIVADSAVCPGTTTCVWLKATQTVTNGIIGMNYCLSYDTANFTPTGNATLGQVVYAALGQGNGEAVQINTAVPGQVYATIYYNASVPLGTFWQGSGDVICIEFAVNPNAATGSYNFSACEVEEAYELFELGKCATPGDVVLGSNSIVNGKVYYWDYDGVNNGPARPLVYDVNNPNDHLITTVNAANGSGAWTHTDINGDFSWNALDGHQIILDRDIDGDYYDTTCTDVFAFINGADAYLAALINNFDMHNLLDSNFAWIPNKYQMVAGDVNMNDKVRANDVTHIMSRSVRSICEFPQVWNYTLGSPANPLPDTTLGVSKDWRFLPADDSSYTAPVDWTVDANYPVYVSANATGGYWRDDVPSVPDTIDLFTPDSTQVCPNYADRSFEAVLLGDLTGSWDPTSSLGTGVRASGNGIIHFDVYPIAGQNNKYNIEVSFEALSDRSSIDFRMDYDENALTVDNVSATIEASTAGLITDWNNFGNDKLYVSAYTLTGVGTKDAIYNIEVSTNGAISTQDLGTILPMLNGDIVNADVTIHGTTGVKDEYTQAGYFNVYPNPSSGMINIEYAFAEAGNVNLNITNVLGQSVFTANLGNMETLNMKTLDLSRFESGVYHIRLASEKGEVVKQIILE
ncbi:MAG: choice-of-anchor L domain-containing protein [Flavobacteriales bacterium]|nr:choice-of-anchor L domain-containing protein [Flavobacteriales bacterium]